MDEEDSRMPPVQEFSTQLQNKPKMTQKYWHFIHVHTEFNIWEWLTGVLGKVCEKGRKCNCGNLHYENKMGASLVVQWLGIHPPMQGTWVLSPVREDPTSPGVTQPMCHSYWACALEPLSPSYRDHKPQLRKPAHPEPVLHDRRSHHGEKPVLRS